MARKAAVAGFVLMTLLFGLVVPSTDYDYELAKQMGPESLYNYRLKHNMLPVKNYHQVGGLLFDTGQVYPPLKKPVIPTPKPAKRRRRYKKTRPPAGGDQLVPKVPNAQWDIFNKDTFFQALHSRSGELEKRNDQILFSKDPYKQEKELLDGREEGAEILQKGGCSGWAEISWILSLLTSGSFETFLHATQTTHLIHVTSPSPKVSCLSGCVIEELLKNVAGVITKATDTPHSRQSFFGVFRLSIGDFRTLDTSQFFKFTIPVLTVPPRFSLSMHGVNFCHEQPAGTFLVCFSF